MTRHELISREIHMAFDLVRYLIENPPLLDEIPEGAVVNVESPDRPPIPAPRGVPVVAFTARRVFRRSGEAA